MIRNSIIRQIEVLIGPLPEYLGGGTVSQALRFYADGSAAQLRIKFSITKHIESTATPTTIDIYNLSPKTRNILRKSELQAVINVGFIGSDLVEIFSGSLMNSVSKRDGASIATTFLCLPGFGATSRALLSKTWSSGTTVDSIVRDLAGQFQGITLSQSTIKLSNNVVGSQGYSCVGVVSDTLDRLARSYGFSWWINSGLFYALEDKEAFEGSKIKINSSNGYLLRAEPMLASPMQRKSGVSVNSFLHAGLNPGKIIDVKSDINPDLNGEYKMHQVNHVGDSDSDQWSSTVQSWIVG